MGETIGSVFQWAKTVKETREEFMNDFCIVFCEVNQSQPVVELENNAQIGEGQVGRGQGEIVWNHFDGQGQAENLHVYGGPSLSTCFQLKS